jgi:hypothetical protein
LKPPPPRPEGVTPQVEQAIERGVKYLLTIRETNGSWGASPEKPYVYPVAVTGLVGLALLAHGDTPTRGEHADFVARIADFLLESQEELTTESGKRAVLISGGQESEPRGRKGPRPMFGHAYALTFLAHIYGQEGDLGRRERIRKALREGVELINMTQTEDGGWGYAPDYHEDEGTLTVTQLQALRSCRDAGIFVPRATIDQGVAFIEKSSNADGSVRYRASPREEIRPGVTCAAVVALWNAGQYNSPRLKKTMDFVNRHIDFAWDRGYEHAEYVAYYLAQAKWIMGGEEWKDFYESTSRQLVSLQESDGHWEGEDQLRYGTTFATAIALIILQLPYERLPVYQR